MFSLPNVRVFELLQVKTYFLHVFKIRLSCPSFWVVILNAFEAPHFEFSNFEVGDFEIAIFERQVLGVLSALFFIAIVRFLV